jgi:hypothetical protein
MDNLCINCKHCDFDNQDKWDAKGTEVWIIPPPKKAPLLPPPPPRPSNTPNQNRSNTNINTSSTNNANIFKK